MSRSAHRSLQAYTSTRDAAALRGQESTEQYPTVAENLAALQGVLIRVGRLIMLLHLRGCDSDEPTPPARLDVMPPSESQRGSCKSTVFRRITPSPIACALVMGHVERRVRVGVRLAAGGMCRCNTAWCPVLCI